MACFVVSAAAAIGVGAAKYVVKHHEKKLELKPQEEPKEYKFGSEVKWSKKLGYLELILWSGSFVLAGEHMLHGEVSPNFPFLTASTEGPEAVNDMLYEMGTRGVAMFGLLVLAWAIGVFVVDFIKYKKHKAKEAAKAEEVKA